MFFLVVNLDGCSQGEPLCLNWGMLVAIDLVRLFAVSLSWFSLSAHWCGCFLNVLVVCICAGV